LATLGRPGSEAGPERTAEATIKNLLGIDVKPDAAVFEHGRVIRMSEGDILSRNIHVLKELQRVAWRNLADPALTIFERREIRNEIKQSDAELRSYLEMISDRSRFRERPVDPMWPTASASLNSGFWPETSDT
jgi:hypothetical protein